MTYIAMLSGAIGIQYFVRRYLHCIRHIYAKNHLDSRLVLYILFL